MVFSISITKTLYSIFSLPCLLHVLPISAFMICWPLQLYIKCTCYHFPLYFTLSRQFLICISWGFNFPFLEFSCPYNHKLRSFLNEAKRRSHNIADKIILRFLDFRWSDTEFQCDRFISYVCLMIYSAKLYSYF
jgi:hypothetical protein